MVDRTVGDYRLLRLVGQGAAGEVHLATAIVPKPFAEKGDLLAVKLYKADILSRQGQEERIRREFQVGSTIAHPNIVRVFEYSPASGSLPPFLVMEYVDGVPLDSWISMFRPIPSRLIVRIFRQLVAAVRELHTNELLHRDIKAPNVMLSTIFDAKLMDFGVVRITRDTPLTPKDQFLGTIRNSSPEMLNGRDYDRPADLYSLGTVMYALLHGEDIFAGEKQFARLVSLVTSATPEFDQTIAARDSVSARLLDLTRRLLAKDPTLRPSIDDLASELTGLASGPDSSDPLHGYVATPLTGLSSVEAEANAFASSLVAEIAKGHDIYVYQPRRATDPVLHPDVEATTVHLMDRRRVAGADLLFLLANEPSFGAGQEMEIGASYNKPTIVLARKGTRISRMLLGSFANILEVVYYVSPEDFEAQLKKVLARHVALIRQAKKTSGRLSSLHLEGRLKELRLAAGYESIEAFGEAIGMAPRVLSHLESGELDNPSLHVLRHIAQGLNVSVIDLIGRTDVLPISAAQDDNLRSLERISKERNLTAVDFLELRDDYLRQLAAKGEPHRLSDNDWWQRHIALEERRFRDKGEGNQSHQERLL